MLLLFYTVINLRRKLCRRANNIFTRKMYWSKTLQIQTRLASAASIDNPSPSINADMSSSLIEGKLNTFIKSCEARGKTDGIWLTKSNTSKVLQMVILFCWRKGRRVDTECLLNNIRAKAISKNVTVDRQWILWTSTSEMKGFYIVMDNAPLHTADDIDEMISKRGYRSIYLPLIHLNSILSRILDPQ